jgi:hypothetical protein
MLYRDDDPILSRSTKNRPVFGLSSGFGEPQLGGRRFKSFRPDQ